MRAIVLAAAVLFAALTGVGSAAATPSGHAAVHAKKKCKRVKKRVHGKVRTVRVCKKAKRRPTLPSRVSPTLDRAHAQTASISAGSGATLSAGGVTLTVPAGAVAATTSVTMTPVTRIRGLKGKLFGAVQFQPEGLRLSKPLTLTIDVPSTAGLKAFSYTGNGREFRLYPVKIEGGKATLELLHFSGYGVGKGWRQPSLAHVRWAVNFAKRAVEIAKQDPSLFNFEMAELSFEEVLSEVAALSSAQSDEFTEPVVALGNGVAVALRRLADAEHRKCVQGDDVVETGKNIELARKRMEGSGLAAAEPFRSALSYALAQRQKCERFELDFDSYIALSTDAGYLVSRVRVKGLQLNSGNRWANQAPLDYWSYEIPSVPTCSLAIRRRVDAPFQAELGSVLDWYAGGSPPKISMRVGVGKAAEITTVTCPGATQTLETRFWEAGIATLHGSLAWTIGDWQYVGKSPYARRTYDGQGSGWSEHTTFTLRHTPQ